MDHHILSGTNFGLVSIIMPNYNGQKYLQAAIDSVLAQSYENWELIIADDNSDDHSLEIIQSYKDPRIHLICNSHNCGAAVSRNKAITEASGRWIAFLDGDDLWEKEKLENHIAFMLEKEAAFSFTHYRVMDASGAVVSEFSPKKDRYNFRMILKHCYIGCSTAIYDTEKLGKVYMPENAEKREDFACWLSILRSGFDAVCFHKCLATYRIHNHSVSSNKLQLIRYQWNVYKMVEKLSFMDSVWLMMHWAVKGVLKYK